jgi:GTPase SAR1 family protein
MSDEIPIVKEVKTKQYISKQSKYKMLGALPSSMIVVGPSGSGKTTLLNSLITDLYRNSFERIYIFSPSIFVDAAWLPVRDYIEKEMKVIPSEDDEIYFDHYSEEKLQNIIDTQHKIIKYMKEHSYKKMFNIMVLIDDMADCSDFMRSSKLLHQLYIRGRHNFITVCTAVQRYYCLAPIIRLNTRMMFLYKLRNQKDLDSITEEISALVDKKTFLTIYEKATEQPFSFLYINLISQDKNNMFYINFDKRIEIN